MLRSCLAVVGITVVFACAWPRASVQSVPEWTRVGIADTPHRYSFGLELADLDLDGDEDVIVPEVHQVFGPPDALGLYPCAPRPTQSDLVWYEHTSERQFTRRVIDTGQPGWFERLHVADLNGDGAPDVIAADNSGDYGNPVTIYYGTGGASWTRYQQTTPIARPYAIASGDLNVDGRLDLVLTAYGAGGVWALLQPSSGPWTPVLIGDGLPEPRGLRVADLDQNGRPDIVVAAAGASDVPDEPWSNHLSQVAIFYGQGMVPWGPASFTKSMVDTATRAPIHLRVTQIDSGGTPELLVAFGLRDALTTRQHVSFFTLTGYTGQSVVSGAQWESWQRTLVGPLTAAIDAEAADIDGDGDQDIVGAAHAFPGGNAVVWWEQSPDGWRQRYVGEAPAVNEIRVRDLDGDGRLDIVGVLDTGNGCPRLANGSRVVAWYQR